MMSKDKVYTEEQIEKLKQSGVDVDRLLTSIEKKKNCRGVSCKND